MPAISLRKVTPELNRKTLSKSWAVNERSEVKNQNHKLFSEKQINPVIGTSTQLNVHELHSGVKLEIQQTWKRHSLRKKRTDINWNSSVLWNMLSLSPKQLLLSSEHPFYIVVHFLLNGSSWTHLLSSSFYPLLLTFLLTRAMPTWSVGDRTGSKCLWVRKFWSELFASFFLASSTQESNEESAGFFSVEDSYKTCYI